MVTMGPAMLREIIAPLVATLVAAPAKVIVEKDGPFIAVLSFKFKVYDTCATGSWRKTRCGASAGDRLPMGGNGASCRVRPMESRAVFPVLDCTIRLPSASVCTDSLVLVAE